MSAWHATFTDLMRSRFPALVAYGTVLTGDRGSGRELAERASVVVFSGRRAPRDRGVAEREAREWMARDVAATDPMRAASVLKAVDGLDDDGVQRVLGKATVAVEPSPAEFASLRDRFLAEAAIYASPTSGVNQVIAPARRSHQAALTRAGVLGAVGAVAVVALTYAGMAWVPGAMSAGAPTASPSSSPSSSLLAVTWNPEPEVRAAMEGFIWPECGDTFAPAPQAVGNVIPAPRFQGKQEDSELGDWYMIGTGFDTQDGANRTVVGTGNSFVVTLDDVVVYVQPGDAQNFDAFTTGLDTGGGMGIQRSSLCDAQKVLDKEFGDIDWNSLTPEEQQDANDRYMAFAKGLGDLEPGTYRVYGISPIVFGEQAALARAFLLSGESNVSMLTQDLGYTSFATDPRVTPYCTETVEVDWTEVHCDVPPDVLRDVLTLEIDRGTVVNTEPGMGISEPLELEVD